MIPLSPILVVEIFDVWEIDFMGLFIPSKDFEYILYVVDYESKWVVAVATCTNDHKVVVNSFAKYFLDSVPLHNH